MFVNSLDFILDCIISCWAISDWSIWQAEAFTAEMSSPSLFWNWLGSKIVLSLDSERKRLDFLDFLPERGGFLDAYRSNLKLAVLPYESSNLNFLSSENSFDLS
jgi:hypothetical protein